MKSQKRKDELDRMAAMLSCLGGRGYQIQEEYAPYGIDFDPEENKSQQTDALDAHSSRQ